MPLVYTIGHSTRPVAEFIAILEHVGIGGDDLPDRCTLRPPPRRERALGLESRLGVRGRCGQRGIPSRCSFLDGHKQR